MQETLLTLSLRVNELYNVLKYMRNNINIIALHLNKNNTIKIIGDIHRNYYIKPEEVKQLIT
jgi:hypothetical protein